MPTPEPGGTLWRVFPWDPAAQPGERFSPTYVPWHQGSGRFDLGETPVLYLAETPEHAIAEKIGRFRGTDLRDHHLFEFGRRLALVSLEVTGARRDRIVDLCDPAVLATHGIRPDHLAARDCTLSQAVAARLFVEGAAGIRWWSAYMGEWHTVALFTARVEAADLACGTPELLEIGDARVRAAAHALGMPVAEPSKHR